MIPRLHDALDELAGDAPLRVDTARVLKVARRRRRVRLAAVPAVAAAAAAAVFAGTALTGGH
ncbi:hypothetical protein, partial [Actinomadura harenae]